MHLTYSSSHSFRFIPVLITDIGQFLSDFLSLLFLAIIRQTLCHESNKRDSQYLTVNFIQISIEGENLETNTPINLETPTDGALIHDQSIANVLFDRLIRVEIKWQQTSGARLCLSGLEVRKIGLLQPIQVKRRLFKVFQSEP